MSWKARLKDIKQPCKYDIHAVVGIIKRDNKILIGKRPSGKPYSGFWEFPGGKVEPNELCFDALKRELIEELGICITSAKPWFTHMHTYPDKSVLLDIWVVESFVGEPQSKENQELQWVGWPEIKELHLLEGNLAILDKISLICSDHPPNI